MITSLGLSLSFPGVLNCCGFRFWLVLLSSSARGAAPSPAFASEVVIARVESPHPSAGAASCRRQLSQHFAPGAFGASLHQGDIFGVPLLDEDRGVPDEEERERRMEQELFALCVTRSRKQELSPTTFNTLMRMARPHRITIDSRLWRLSTVLGNTRLLWRSRQQNR